MDMNISIIISLVVLGLSILTQAVTTGITFGRLKAEHARLLEDFKEEKCKAVEFRIEMRKAYQEINEKIYERLSKQEEKIYIKLDALEKSYHSQTETLIKLKEQIEFLKGK